MNKAEIVQSPLCLSKSKSVEASTATSNGPVPVASQTEPIKTTKGEVKPFFWLPEQYLQDNPVEETGSGSEEEEKKETVQEVVDFAIRDIKSISEERFSVLQNPLWRTKRTIVITYTVYLYGIRKLYHYMYLVRND